MDGWMRGMLAYNNSLVRLKLALCFKDINVHSKSTRQKPTSWSQIVERTKNASLLVDVKIVPYAISC